MSLADTSSNITFYFIIICMPIGIILDLFAIYIFSRQNLLRSKTNMSFLFTCKFSIDIVLMLTYIFITRADILLGVNLIEYSNVTCSIFSFFRRYIMHVTGFMTVFISFDRFVYVHYSNGRLRFMRDRKSLIITLAVMFLIVALLDIEKFFFHIVEKPDINLSYTTLMNVTNTKVVRTCVSIFSNYVLSEIVSVSLRIHIPILLMFIFNILLIYKLLKSKSRINLRNHRKEAQFTFSVLFSSIAYLVLYTPIAVLFGFRHYYLLTGKATERPFPDYSKEIFYFLFDLSINFSLLYETFLFFIIMGGNKLFRQEVWIVLHVRNPARLSAKQLNNQNELQSIQLVTNHESPGNREEESNQADELK